MNFKKVVAIILMTICIILTLVSCNLEYTTSSTNIKYVLNKDRSSYSAIPGCDYCTNECKCKCHIELGLGSYCDNCSEKCLVLCYCECHENSDDKYCENCSNECTPSHFEIVIDRYKKWPVSQINDTFLQNCNHVKRVAIKDNVYIIGTKVLYNCDSLESLILGKNIYKIGKDSFSECDNLKTVYFLGTEKDWVDLGNKSENIVDEDVYMTLSDIVYYYSDSKPSENGNYWHYVDGLPEKW